MVERIKIDIGFQDIEAPVYNSFINMEQGPAVLYGLNVKNQGTLSTGRIMGRCGMIVPYKPSRKYFRHVMDTVRELPEKSLIWLSGEYNGFSMDVVGCGVSEDFPNSKLSRRLETRFKEDFDIDTFEYIKSNFFGHFFKAKGRIEVYRCAHGTPYVYLLNDDNRRVGLIATNYEKFMHYKNKVKFNTRISRTSMMSDTIKVLEPRV